MGKPLSKTQMKQLALSMIASTIGSEMFGETFDESDLAPDEIYAIFELIEIEKIRF